MTSMRTVLSFVAVLFVFGCNQCSSLPEKLSNVHERQDVKDAIQKAQLTSIQLRSGSGDTIAKGQTAVVHYTGWLTTGEQFDSSRDRKEPFSFNVGAEMVIRGWDVGVEGMKVGERKLLVIPPEMGYGEAGAGQVIPPQSTLIFDVELVEIRSAPN